MIKLIINYINLELQNKNHLKQFLSKFKNKWEVCQIIETGNHYIFLKFKLNSSSIIFCKFQTKI